MACGACDKHVDVENITLYDFQCVFKLFVKICAAYLYANNTIFRSFQQ